MISAAAAGASVFRFLATHAAPWIAAFLLGVAWHAQTVSKGQIDALEDEKDAAVKALAESAGRLAAFEARDAALETERLKQLEELRDVFQEPRPPGDPNRACVPDARERERLRRQTQAANRYVAGALPGGDRAVEGAGDPAGARAPARDPRRREP